MISKYTVRRCGGCCDVPPKIPFTNEGLPSRSYWLKLTFSCLPSLGIALTKENYFIQGNVCFQAQPTSMYMKVQVSHLNSERPSSRNPVVSADAFFRAALQFSSSSSLCPTQLSCPRFHQGWSRSQVLPDEYLACSSLSQYLLLKEHTWEQRISIMIKRKKERGMHCVVGGMGKGCGITQVFRVGSVEKMIWAKWEGSGKSYPHKFWGAEHSRKFKEERTVRTITMRQVQAWYVEGASGHPGWLELTWGQS